MRKFSVRFGIAFGFLVVLNPHHFSDIATASTPTTSSQAVVADQIYDLKLELTLDGKISSPRLIVQDGQRASIEQVSHDAHTFVEVTATGSKLDRKQIMVDLVVGTIDRAGTRTIVSNPRILAHENERAQITIQNDEGSGNLSLAVVARRKVL